MNINGINFPSGLKDIRKLVQQNPNLDMHINVLFFHCGELYPLTKDGIRCQGKSGKNVINLVLLTTSKKDSIESGNHFCLIKDIDLFLASNVREPTEHSIQKLPSPRKSKWYKKFFCLACMSQFSNASGLRKHKLLCSNKRRQVEILPQETDKIKFKHFNRKYQSEIFGFYDLESVLVPTGEIRKCELCGNTCKCDTACTLKESYHRPVVWSLLLMDVDGEILVEKVGFCEKQEAHVRLLEFLLSKRKTLNEILHR